MLPGRLNDKFRVFGAKSHGDPRWSKTSKDNKSKGQICQWKKSSKEYSVVFLVEGQKFNLGQKKFDDKVQAKSSNFPYRFGCELGRHTA